MGRVYRNEDTLQKFFKIRRETVSLSEKVAGMITISYTLKKVANRKVNPEEDTFCLFDNRLNQFVIRRLT